MPLPAALCCAVLLVACQSQPKMPAKVGLGMIGLAHNKQCYVERCTRPKMLPPDAPPIIQGMVFMNGLAPGIGEPFVGTIYTSSNVASVELRTNLFSLIGAKKGVGRFEVDVDVYDLPGIFIRPYTLRVIARNTRGDQTEEDLPFRIRGSR